MYFKFQISISFFYVRYRVSKLGCRCAKHNLEPFSLLHISKYISVMYIKLAEATEGLHCSVQFTFQTIISFSMSNRGSQNWDPGTQNINFELFSHFHCSISQKLFEVCLWNVQILQKVYLCLYISNFRPLSLFLCKI